VTVLGIALLEAAVFGGVFRVFLHVVRGRIGYHAGRGDGVTHMLGEIKLAAPYFPGAAVVSGEHELLGAVALGQTSGYVSHIGLILGQPRQGTEAQQNCAAQNEFETWMVSGKNALSDRFLGS
jgi:hypothetical protein